MRGWMHFSRIFEAGQSKETGLYELLRHASLPGFSSGIMTDDFQIAGIWHLLSDRLKIFVR